MDKGLEFKEKRDMNSRLVLFQGVASLINSRIGREIKDYELRAVSFAVDELYQGPEAMTADQFLEGRLGVKKEDNQRDASWHIYETVYNLKKQKLGREIELASSVSDQEKLKSLNKIGGLMQSGYTEAFGIYSDGKTPIDTIGGIMDEWVPEWFSNPQAR